MFKQVLYLDDDKSDIAYAFANFQGSDFILKCVDTPAKAIEELEKGIYTLVISDMLMDPDDGLVFARKMEEKGIKAPMIFISGDPLTARSKEYRNEYEAIDNCKGFIIKPLTVDKVKRFV